MSGHRQFDIGKTGPLSGVGFPRSIQEVIRARPASSHISEVNGIQRPPVAYFKANAADSIVSNQIKVGTDKNTKGDNDGTKLTQHF